ncbi:aldose 1-epimerase [Candidatus Pacearchaeota archaeon]|nr:aldose 1-epimerase [Candidatus Pacearchaeota archaeon]
MFKIKREKYGKFNKIYLINTKTKEYISIIPEFGANVNEIILYANKKNYSIIDGDSNYKQLIKNKWFKGAKLIPFPNRIKDGSYLHLGAQYSLPINFPAQHHAIHGLIYNKKFTIKKIIKSSSFVSLILENRLRNLKGYPFDITITINYSISKRGFKCTTLVKNNSKTPIPFGDGWHPYFKTKSKVNNLFLKLPSNKKISVDKRMIPTGNKRIFSKFSKLNKIKNQKFDTGFKLAEKESIATTEIKDANKNLKICVWQETGKNKYNYLQVFIPPSRNSIAIEPMTCNTNAFSNKEGLIILKPKETFLASYGIYIEPLTKPPSVPQ